MAISDRPNRHIRFANLTFLAVFVIGNQFANGGFSGSTQGQVTSPRGISSSAPASISAKISKSESSAASSRALPFSTNPIPTDSYTYLHNGSPSTPWTTFVGAGVDGILGNFVYQVTDLSVTGRGPSFIFQQSYNSANTTAGKVKFANLI